ncbi:MAG: class I adenylate-forming enzyme family protein, partial [Dehalococcoidia bacterium]|nr:class I adenylate-forming enzyme family protein [Dehalococcoidia bacterium]
MGIPTLYTRELYESYTRQGYWTEQAIADLWDINGQRFPDREAVVDSGTRLTWSEGVTWINRMALGLLELGLKKDELVILQLPNSVELVLLRVACEKAGLLGLPALRTFRHTEMEHIIEHSRAAAVVVLPEFRGFNYREMYRDIQPKFPFMKHIIYAGVNPPADSLSIKNMVGSPLESKYPGDYLASKKTPWNEFSLVLHTSGTTGLPRLSEYPVCSNVYLGRATAERLGLTPDDIVFTISPAGLGPSMPCHLAAPVAGSKIVMQEHFTAGEALKVIEKEKVTVLGAVPAQLAMLSAVLAVKKYDTSSLKVIRVTGSPLAYHVGKEAEERLGAPIIQSYGSVDFSGVGSGLPQESMDARLLTAGYPNPGNEIKLVDEAGNEVPEGEVGEILGRGPTAVSGYYKDKEDTGKTWEDGWCHMGDLGKFDSAGRLMVVGRKKEMIIRGGQNIYPAEIEALPVTHPS